MSKFAAPEERTGNKEEIAPLGGKGSNIVKKKTSVCVL